MVVGFSAPLAAKRVGHQNHQLPKSLKITCKILNNHKKLGFL